MEKGIWYNPKEPKPKVCLKCGNRLRGKEARKIRCPQCGSFLLIRDRILM